LKKQKEKAEREQFINSCMKEINDELDRSYIVIDDMLEKISKDFVDSAIKIEEYKQSLIHIAYRDDLDKESYSDYKEVKDIITNIEEIRKNMNSKYIDMFSDSTENSILQLAEESINKIADIIKSIQADIKGQKNDFLILSILLDRSKRILEEYNTYIVESVLESNPYIDAYIETEESYYNFLLEIVGDKEDNPEDITQEEIRKYNDRLRVEYSDLSRFLTLKGYVCVRQNSTTHAIWRNEELGISVPLPNKSGTVPQGTVSKLLRIINSNRYELAEFIMEE
jgi:hypothetical protein